MNNRNKQFLPFFLQFINTAISEDVKTVNNSLESSISEVISQAPRRIFHLIILFAVQVVYYNYFNRLSLSYRWHPEDSEKND